MKISSFLWLNIFGVDCQETRTKPNVIILLADDLGMGDISLNNRRGKIKTPNIDQIGLEGVNFLDAHSASTKCSPSRYMLMTGRYNFDDNPSPGHRKLKPGTPHLADMFKRNGYKTAIIGKHQPIQDDFEALDVSKQEHQSQMKKFEIWKKSLGGGSGERSPGEHKKSFFLPSNYTMPFGPHTRNYDYSFLNQYACCRVGGGYFENGVGTEPFTKFAFQRPYPEGSNERGGTECQSYISYYGEHRCGDKPFANGYLAPPYSDSRVDGPVLVPNFPPSILVQPSYDSREIEQRLASKALTFIRENANKEEPFFLYYGFRAGHNPFNSPRRFRNQSQAGEIGEAVMELDSIIGRVMETLKLRKIDENTVVIFMSDNGAISRWNSETGTRPYPDGSYMWDTYRHYQNAIDLNGQNYKLNGGKQSAYEGGHRLPFLWRYPKLIKEPRVVQNATVSFIDVYRTLAEIIGERDLGCNEAPDSRSLIQLLNGKSSSIQGPIVHHSIFQGTKSIRINNWKLIDGSNELFDLDNDMEEMHNLYENRPDKVRALKVKLDEITKRVDEREKRTREGREPGLC